MEISLSADLTYQQEWSMTPFYVRTVVIWTELPVIRGIDAIQKNMDAAHSMASICFMEHRDTLRRPIAVPWRKSLAMAVTWIEFPITRYIHVIHKIVDARALSFRYVCGTSQEMWLTAAVVCTERPITGGIDVMWKSVDAATAHLTAVLMSQLNPYG